MQPIIEIKGLRKSYGALAVVKDLSLDIHAGEIFAILGPNGAGKTTTVEILEGFRNADSGEISVLGINPAIINEKLIECICILGNRIFTA